MEERCEVFYVCLLTSYSDQISKMKVSYARIKTWLIFSHILTSIDIES